MKLLILFLILLFEFSNATLIRDEKFSTTDFKLLDDKTIELLNPFRQNAKLKFTFEGGNFTRFEHKHQSLWTLNMHGSNSNVILIDSTSTDKKKKMTNFIFQWRNSDKNHTNQTVCFEVGYNNASWYSTYLEKDQPWPLNTGNAYPKMLPLNTGSYGPNQFGPIVDQLFLNTDGFAISFQQYYPIYIQRKDKQICLTVKSVHSTKIAKNNFTSMHFSLISSENIQKVHYQSINNFFVIRKIYPKGTIPDGRMFNQTSFNLNVKNLNQSKVIEKANEIVKHGLKNILLVLENWKAHFGELLFDKTRFSNSKILISELHKLGFVIKLQVNSFVSFQSKIFQNHSNFLVKKLNDENKSFTFNWTTHGTGSLINYLDYHNNFEAQRWLTTKLQFLQKSEGIDSFQFIGGDFEQYGVAESLLLHSGNAEHHSNAYSTFQALTAKKLGTFVDVDAGYKSQNIPIFTQMRHIEPNWNALKSVIPSALTMGLAGYSFVVAPAFKPDSKPSEELYIRWLQLTTFLPSMQFSVASWNVSNKTVNLAIKFIALHLEHTQTIINIAKYSAGAGEPLLRPLWYLSPDDSRTYSISDQFAVGNDLIVAPVLVQGQKEKVVYLPSGTWLDQHGKSYSGPAEFKILTPIEELAYFKRKISVVN